jgi:hypothetical protein
LANLAEKTVIKSEATEVNDKDVDRRQLIKKKGWVTEYESKKLALIKTRN